jgi:hypothetical protein
MLPGFLLFVLLLNADLLVGMEPLTFDHYYDHAEVTRTLKALTKAYPRFMTIKSLGKSYQGREIWSVTLNNPKTGPAKHKPGFYIDANIHGNEIQGTETALYTLWYLLKNYGKTELVTRLLDEKAFYFIPTMNPDSRDVYINGVADPDWPRTGLIPQDEDQDGVADEDSADDLDGDGSITQMWMKDPNGAFKRHPSNPEVLVPKRPGERGEFRFLGMEGIDNDGDGKMNEDPPGGYDMNRNYGYNWQPGYVQRGAGHYPFCWPETRATLAFLLANPNIAGAQNYHNFGGMIVRGPGAMNLGNIPVADINVYDYIGKRGEKILPGYKYMTVYKDMYTVYGGSVDFLFNTLGIYSFVNELDIDPFDVFGLYADEKAEGEIKKEDADLQHWRSLLNDLNRMLYHERVLLGEQYTKLKPYKHPLYGDIYIGGVKKFGQRVSPLFKLAETCHRNTAFCLFHADQLARLAFDKVKVKKLGDGLYQLDVTIANSRVTPSISTWAKQKKLHRADRFKIAGGSVKLLATGLLTDPFRGTSKKIECRKNSFWVEGGIPGFGKVDFRLLVKGSGNVGLIYDSLKGGLHKQSVRLK